MWTDRVALIEYDIQRVPSPPFSIEENIQSISGWNSILETGSDTSPFFGAVAGVCNSTDVLPLFPARGIPEPIDPLVYREIFYFREGGTITYLYLREINAVLRHHKITVNIETVVLLDLLETLENRFGIDHARMIFGFFHLEEDF